MKLFAIIFCGILALIMAIIILKPSPKKKPPLKARKKIKKTKAPPLVLKKPKPHARQEEFNDMAQNHPELVGLILKQWLNEDKLKKKSDPPTPKV